MKRRVSILLATLMLPFGAAMAQNIILGEKTPEIKAVTWLDDHQANAAQWTYIEFYHPTNKACQTSLGQLKKLTEKMNTKLRIVVITQESADKVAEALRPYLSPQIAVGIDTQGKVFAAYGISYIPFGVLTDAKNRALWIGNSLQFNEKTIEQVTR